MAFWLTDVYRQGRVRYWTENCVLHISNWIYNILWYLCRARILCQLVDLPSSRSPTVFGICDCNAILAIRETFLDSHKLKCQCYNTKSTERSTITFVQSKVFNCCYAIYRFSRRNEEDSRSDRDLRIFGALKRVFEIF